MTSIRFLMLTAGLLLTACAATVITACPPVVEYDEAFTKAFADQLTTIPEGSPVAVFVLDSVALRDKVRACR